jgi:hypothetical protein
MGGIRCELSPGRPRRVASRTGPRALLRGPGRCRGGRRPHRKRARLAPGGRGRPLHPAEGDALACLAPRRGCGRSPRAHGGGAAHFRLHRGGVVRRGAAAPPRVRAAVPRPPRSGKRRVRVPARPGDLRSQSSKLSSCAPRELARLRRGQGCVTYARDLLAPVSASSTESFASTDLVEARPRDCGDAAERRSVPTPGICHHRPRTDRHRRSPVDDEAPARRRHLKRVSKPTPECIGTDQRARGQHSACR